MGKYESGLFNHVLVRWLWKILRVQMGSREVDYSALVVSICLIFFRIFWWPIDVSWQMSVFCLQKDHALFGWKHALKVLVQNWKKAHSHAWRLHFACQTSLQLSTRLKGSKWWDLCDQDIFRQKDNSHQWMSEPVTLPQVSKWCKPTSKCAWKCVNDRKSDRCHICIYL